MNGICFEINNILLIPTLHITSLHECLCIMLVFRISKTYKTSVDLRQHRYCLLELVVGSTFENRTQMLPREMDLLRFSKTLLKVLNLWSAEDYPAVTPITSKIRYILTVTFPTMLLIGSFRYTLQQIDNIDEATEPGFVCCAYITSISTYCWLIHKKRLIKSAIKELEAIVYERKD